MINNLHLLIKQTIIFFKGNITIFSISILYFFGLLLTRFIPETPAYALVGYLFTGNFFETKELTNFISLYSYIPLILFSFFIGLQFPWHKFNLLRKKLYRTTFSSYILTVAFLILIFYIIHKNSIPGLDIFKTKPLYFSIFLFSLLFVSIPEILTTIRNSKASGPLTTVTQGSAVLFNIITLFLFVISLGVTARIEFYSFVLLPLAGALSIILILFLLRLIANIKNTTLIYRIIILALLFALTAGNNITALFMPLYTGILLSFLFRGETKELFPLEIIRISINLSLLFCLPLLKINTLVIYIVIGFILLKNILLKTTTYLSGRIFNQNETVYKNLGGALSIQSIFPLLALFWLKQQNIILYNDLSLWLSVLLLVIVIETLFFNFRFKKLLKAAGELAE